MLHSGIFPSLITDRLLLRRLAAEDETEIFKLRSDDRVNEFLDRPKILSLQEAGQFIQKINNGFDKNEWLYWAIVLKNEPSLLIGTICLWNFSAGHAVAELGYELLPGLQGRGIMQEAIKAVIDLGFEKLKIHTIKAYTHSQNKKSSRLLEKFNFKIKTKHEPQDGNEEELKNMIIYTLGYDAS